MPRLQILQHKSYHPYLESNKQRVRDDEAKAAALEAEEERTSLGLVSLSPPPPFLSSLTKLVERRRKISVFEG
jgi:hypothetical protein